MIVKLTSEQRQKLRRKLFVTCDEPTNILRIFSLASPPRTVNFCRTLSNLTFRRKNFLPSRPPFSRPRYTEHSSKTRIMHATPVLAAQVAAPSSSELPPAPLQPPTESPAASSSAAPADAPVSTVKDGAEQYLLVLSGLIGSGKSTFARALTTHYPNWRRCNQDELGDRHAVLYSARTALLSGQNVIIDRTNIDAKQRRTWLELAAELNSASSLNIITISLTLTIPIELAEERLRVRVGHETIKTAEQALGILPHFLRSYQKASLEEGFNYVLSWPAGRMKLEMEKGDVEEMLFRRLEGEERGEGVLPEKPPMRAGGRGRGRGRGEWRGGRGRGASAVYTPHHQHQPCPRREQSEQGQWRPTPLGSNESAQAPPSFAAAASIPPPLTSLQPDAQLQP